MAQDFVHQQYSFAHIWWQRQRPLNPTFPGWSNAVPPWWMCHLPMIGMAHGTLMLLGDELREILMDLKKIHVYYTYYIILYHMILYCIVLYCIVLYCIILYHIILYCIILYYIILYYIILYYISLYYIILYYIISYYIISYYIISYYIILYYIIL